MDDVGYLHQLVGELATADGVNHTRVHAVGIASGAMLSYAWACATPGELAGIGVVAGSLLADCPKPAPITLAAVHGTRDRIVPIAGGPGPDTLAGLVSPPLEQTLARFAPPTAARMARPPTRMPGSCTSARGICADGRTVAAATIDGGGHQPRAGGRAAAQGAGHPAAPIDATTWRWEQLHTAHAVSSSPAWNPGHILTLCSDTLTY